MEPEKKSHGALIGSIIIIVILIIGGVYIWQTKFKDAIKGEVQEEQSMNTEQEFSGEEMDELNGLEEEASATDATIDVNASEVE